jgi:hypothetical protein
VLKYVLDENEFLSPYGLRSLSKFHQEHPFTLHIDGVEQRVDYEPAESTSGTFGGNSNWRGPIWFPVNYLWIEALERYHHFYGDNLRVEGGGGGTDVAAGAYLPAGRRRTRAMADRQPVCAGSPLAGFDLILRILRCR